MRDVIKYYSKGFSDLAFAMYKKLYPHTTYDIGTFKTMMLVIYNIEEVDIYSRLRWTTNMVDKYRLFLAFSTAMFGTKPAHEQFGYIWICIEDEGGMSRVYSNGTGKTLDECREEGLCWTEADFYGVEYVDN